MSFLDKVKQNVNNINKDIPSKPQIPGKPTIPGKPPVKKVTEPIDEVKEETKQENKVTPPLEANNPFIKKDLIPKKPEIKEEIKDTAAEETKEEQAVKETTVVNESTEEVKETEVKEEETVTEVKEETKEEEKPKKKRTRKKKTEEEKEEISDMNTEEIELKEIPTTTISYSEAIAAIQSGFIDEEWERFKQDSSERANNIVIQNNMTISQIKNTLAELSSLRDSIWILKLYLKIYLEKIQRELLKE